MAERSDATLDCSARIAVRPWGDVAPAGVFRKTSIVWVRSVDAVRDGLALAVADGTIMASDVHAAAAIVAIKWFRQVRM
jgi:hypothetical protein